MGFWTVLGGVTLGVGAVAAAPFTGGGSILGAASLAGSLAGAGTIAAATGAGVAGAAAAAAISDSDKEEGRRAGERHTTAKYHQKTEKLISALKEADSKLNDDKAYFLLLIALFAVGLATAKADGNISKEETQDLDEFVIGVGHSNLPPHVKGAITKLKNNPPNFTTAMSHVRKVPNVDMSLFEAVIEVISASDGNVSSQEKALLLAFRQEAA